MGNILGGVGGVDGIAGLTGLSAVTFALLWFIFITLAPFIAIVVPLILIKRYRHRERMEFIRQGINPFPEVLSKESLLRGLFFTFVGIALLVSSFILSFVIGDSDPNIPFIFKGGILIVFGCMAVSIGVAFLVYYKITAPDREWLKRQYEEQIQAGKNRSGVTQQTSTDSGSMRDSTDTKI